MLLQIGGHLRRIHRAHEIFDERVEIRVGQVQAAVRFLHAASGVLARTAGGCAELFDQQAAQIGEIGFLEQEVDAQIVVDFGERRIDDAGDAGLTAERAIKPIVRMRMRRRRGGGMCRWRRLAAL